MFNSNATLPVSIPLNAGGFGGGGFGNDFDSIIALAIIAMIFGWNNGGGLFGGGGNAGVTDGYILTTDMSRLDNKIDGIANGISSLGYDQLGQMNGINQNISNLGFNMQAAINSSMTNDSNNARDILAALNDCCCKTQTSFLNAQYNAATEACATRQAIADAKADIVGAIKQQSIDAMAAELAEKDRMLNNQWLLAQINKTPVPAYVVQNPYCNCNYSNYLPTNVYGGTTIA